MIKVEVLKHDTAEIYGGVEVKIQAFLISVLDGDE
jgi:hypothetical protein